MSRTNGSSDSGGVPLTRHHRFSEGRLLPNHGPTDPVPREPLVDLGQHTSLQCEAMFEDRRGVLDPDWDRETAVAKLYEWWHDRHGENLGNEQGGVYVFAYLLEREDQVEPGTEPAVSDVNGALTRGLAGVSRVGAELSYYRYSGTSR